MTNLMLSGSFDWTVRLWNLRDKNLAYTFKHHKNPVTCVNWNNLHPVMFSSSDSSGNVCIMNLYNSLDVPIKKYDFKECVFDVKWDLEGRTLGIGC